MDFILGLHKVDEMPSIIVVMDRFTKYAVFVPILVVCLVEKVIELFLRYVVKHFKVLEDNVSNWDARFTRQFWVALFGLLHAKLKFSNANYPQTDRQTEKINALLEKLLQHYVVTSQKNWLDFLDIA